MARRTSLAKRAELTKLQRESAALKRRINGLEVELYGVPPTQKQLLAPPTGKPKVTDHALVRYLERAHGLDLDPLRRRILGPEVKEAMAIGKEYVFWGDLVVVVHGSQVTTVLTKDMAE